MITHTSHCEDSGPSPNLKPHPPPFKTGTKRTAPCPHRSIWSSPHTHTHTSLPSIRLGNFSATLRNAAPSGHVWYCGELQLPGNVSSACARGAHEHACRKTHRAHCVRPPLIREQLHTQKLYFPAPLCCSSLSSSYSCSSAEQQREASIDTHALSLLLREREREREG